MKDDEEGRKREENILYLVRGGGAEPHERAHGVGALAQELVLLVARDLERFREGKGRGKRRVSGKEKKEFFFPRGPLVDERASESRELDILFNLLFLSSINSKLYFSFSEAKPLLFRLGFPRASKC